MKFLETPDLGIPASRAAWDAIPADDAARLRATWTADVLVVVDGSHLIDAVVDLPVQISDGNKCIPLHVLEAIYGRTLALGAGVDAPLAYCISPV